MIAKLTARLKPHVPALAIAAAAIALAWTFAYSTLVHAREFGLPLDDSYIYLTYAKQFGRAEPSASPQVRPGHFGQEVTERLGLHPDHRVAGEHHPEALGHRPIIAEARMDRLEWGRVEGVCRTAIETLKSRGHPMVVITGFCMGGALALVAASKIESIDASVAFYGIPPADKADLAAIKCPLLGHFASNDDWCTPERVNALKETLKRSARHCHIYRYNASHAFFNDTRPEVYSAAAARSAWSKTLEFLKTL